MSAKQKRIPHVPADAGVINAPSPGSRLDRTPSSHAKKSVILASLAGDIAGIKLEISVLSVGYMRSRTRSLAKTEAEPPSLMRSDHVELTKGMDAINPKVSPGVMRGGHGWASAS